MKSQCIVVPIKKGEEVRRALLDAGLLEKNLAIERSQEHIYMPIRNTIEKTILDFEVIERNFKEIEDKVRNYKELMDVPSDIRTSLPTSFDVIGTVAIIKLTDDLLNYKESIGEAILKANKSIETVTMDSGVKGEERVRQLDVIAGSKDTRTIHKEYGIELEIDPAAVYFSPRLSTERIRVANLVKKGEIVIDMFCGCGPFSMLIAKHGKTDKIYAIDINEKAIWFLKRNIQKNKVSNIIPLHGDSKDLVPTLEPADRIIMNLPHSASEFLSYSISNVKNNGMIHYYAVLDDDEHEKRVDDIISMANKQNRKIAVSQKRAVHTYSPGSSLYCFDLNVE